MTLTGIDRIDFGVEDMAACRRFYIDWGLADAGPIGDGHRFTTLDGSEVLLRPADAPDLSPAIEPGSTVRRVVWGVADAAALATVRQGLSDLPGFAEEAEGPSITDPHGLRLSFRVSQRRPVAVTGAVMNTVDRPDARRDRRAPVYDRAEPVKIGHVVLFSPEVAKAVAWYQETLGFVISDHYPAGGYFLRCQAEGGHHQLFLLQTPDGKSGLNHVAFTVRDIHEVFGGGLHVNRCGWETQIGPGRHPISSAYFWYVHNPAGGLAEYYADEDWCTEQWSGASWERTGPNYAEWGIAGGVDGLTRRQARGTGNGR